ncbi:MAG TPA: flagellar protein FlaG [Rudaea sp.]
MPPDVLSAVHAPRPASAASVAREPERSAAHQQGAQAQRPDPNSSAAVRAHLDFLLDDATRLDYRVDATTKQVVMRVIDRDSGRVLYQVPDDVALQLARWLDHGAHPLVDLTA